MMPTSCPPRGDPHVEVRPYREEDESAVMRLLVVSLGDGPAGRRTSEFFRWKHLANPFGRSCMLVAAAEEEIVGLRTFMRWEFRCDDRLIRAVRAVDTATHPGHQRRGIFSRLTRAALDLLRGEADLIFNTPNERSLPGYLKMGWQLAGEVPVHIQVRRPAAFVRGLSSMRQPDVPTGRSRPTVRADPASKALADGHAVAELLAKTERFDHQFVTRRDIAYLSWRYADAPLLDYRAVVERRDGCLQGLALFRVRPRGRLWEATVAELLVPAGDVRTAGRLLRHIGRAAAVDHVTCSFPAGSVTRRAARRRGFVRSPSGMRLVVNQLATAVAADPTDPAAWGLALGDLEVF